MTFSVNTNLGAMAALQSLSQTQSALASTQNQISSGLSVASAADNPAVYAITQSMDGQIAGLSAVQNNLSFGAQVVGTASSSADSISSTLSTLKSTLTLGQTQGLSATQMNDSISASLQQIDSFANSATFNGVNLISGAVGNGVSDTQLNVLTDTQGSSFTVGGSGAQALNATSAGLGIGSLSTSSTALSIAIGADSSAASTGITLNVAATGLALAAAATGQAATGTTVTLQTSNFGTRSSQTAGNAGQQWAFVLTNNSTGANTTASQNDILNQLNAMAVSAAAASGGTSSDSGATGGVATSGAGAGSTFVVSGGKISLASGSTNGSITDLGNGNTEYSLVTACDSSGNAIRQINVIAVDTTAATSAAGSQLTDLNGGAAGNDTAAKNTRTNVLSQLVTSINSTGFAASLDSTNNLTVVGNNVDTTTAGAATIGNLTSPTSVSSTVTGTTLSGAAGAIANVNAAITKLGNISSALGTASDHITGMQTFASSLSSALTAGVGALTDADLATESAKLQSLQTKQQLGIQALSIANQQPQALLKLFGG